MSRNTQSASTQAAPETSARPSGTSAATANPTSNDNRCSSAHPDEFMGRSADQPLVIGSSLYDMGYRAAIESGEIEVNDRRLVALQAQARTRSLAQTPKTFSPQENPSDQVEQHARERILQKREIAEQAVVWSRKRLFDEMNALAQLVPAGNAPATPRFGLLCACILFAISLAPSLQALFATEGAGLGYQQWILPGVLSLAIGAGLAIPQVRAARAPSSSFWERHMFFLAGLISASGLLRFRLGLSDSAESIAASFGLLALELAAVIIAEGISAAYRREWLLWTEQHQTYTRQNNTVETAKVELTTLSQALQELEFLDNEFRRHLHDRESMHRAGPVLVDESVDTITDGYMAGIHFNRGIALRATISDDNRSRRKT